MKLLFSIIAVFTMVYSSFSNELFNSINKSIDEEYLIAAPCTLSINFMITGKLRKKPECVELGISCLKIQTGKPCNDFISVNQTEGSTIVKFDWISNTEINFYFFNDTGSSIFSVEEAFNLPDAACKVFNRKIITVLNGEYKVEKQRDGSSKVVFRTISR
jgi:hypothetical protein